MTATQAPNRATPSRHPIQRRYRLLHSSGDHLITDRPTALRTLAALPGAKLFVLRERGGEAQKGG